MTKSIITREPYVVGKVRWRLLITTSSSPFNLFMHKRLRSTSGEYFCAIASVINFRVCGGKIRREM